MSSLGVAEMVNLERGVGACRKRKEGDNGQREGGTPVAAVGVAEACGPGRGTATDLVDDKHCAELSGTSRQGEALSNGECA